VTTNCELLFKRNPNKTKLTNFGPTTKATNVGGLLLLRDPHLPRPPPLKINNKNNCRGGGKKNPPRKRDKQ
jgi:hypothetical protein